MNGSAHDFGRSDGDVPGTADGMGKAHIVASSPTDKDIVAHYCLLVKYVYKYMKWRKLWTRNQGQIGDAAERKRKSFRRLELA